jgi:hypothetical protein
MANVLVVDESARGMETMPEMTVKLRNALETR